MRTYVVLVVLLVVAVAAGVWLRLPGERRAAAPLANADAATVEAGPSPAAELRAPPDSIESGPERTPAEEVYGETDAAANGTPARRARVLEFRVADRDGAPLVEARVRVLEPAGLAEGTTDSDGRVALGVSSVEQVLVEVERDGYAHLRTRRDASTPIDVVLHPAIVARGQVRSRATGLPLAGATVERLHDVTRRDWFDPGGGPSSCSGCPPERTVAGEDGRYELGGAPCDPDTRLVFRARAAGHATLAAEFSLRECGASFTRDFELEPGGELSGRVVDFESGAPIAGAVVELALERLECDAEGLFATDRAPAPSPRTSLEARADGFCRLVAPLEGLESPCRLPLVRHATIAGTVRDASAAPVPGVSVGLWDQGMFGTERPPELEGLPPGWQVHAAGNDWSTSGADGAFRIAGAVPWHRRYALDAHAEGFQEAIVALPPLAPGQELVQDVRIEPIVSGTVLGTVTLNGAPVDGTVRWRRADHASGEAPLRDGSYRLEHVPAGGVTVTAYPKDEDIVPFDPAAEVALVVAPGAEVRHDFALRLATSSIAGRARSEAGRALEGLEVRVATERTRSTQGLEQPAWSGSARTGADGAFRVTVPADGSTFVVSARHGVVKRSLAAVAAGTEDVELVFPELARLAYRAIELGSGDALKTYMLLWRPAGVGEALPATWDGKTDPDGYREALVPAGTVDLFLHTSDHLLAAREGVRLQASGDATRVSFELDRGHAVEIQLDPAGRPPAGALVALPRAELWADLGCTRTARGDVLTSGGSFPARATRVLQFFDEGRCTVKGLAAGTYRFKVFHESMTLEPDTIRVPSPDGEPIVVRWSLGAR